MARVRRSAVVDAPAEEVWALLADPHHLPRWWPRCVRVENVQGAEGGGRARWTKVLQTERGSVVRADYRRTASTRPTRLLWEQELVGTPFERILAESRLQMELSADDGTTTVELEAQQRLRGLSRLGGPMMRRGTRRTLDDALDGLRRALGRGEEAHGDPGGGGRR